MVFCTSALAERGKHLIQEGIMPFDVERKAELVSDPAVMVEMLASTCPENPHCTIKLRDYRFDNCPHKVCPRRNHDIVSWALIGQEAVELAEETCATEGV